MKFIKHISTLRYFILVACFILFTCYTTEIKCDLTTKEKIQLHKEWLIRRQKSTHNRILRQPPKNDTEARINHFRKLINFKSSQLPITENDISFTSDITEIIQSHTVPSTEPVTTQTKVALNYYGPSTSNLTASTSPSSPWPGDKNQASSEGSISSTTESFFPPTLKVKSVFSNWSNWTSCSRSCGGGVKSQTRKCVKRTNLDGKKSTFDSTTTESNECIGVFKRFHICNDHKCPDEESLIDYRELQCKKFDNQLFGGKRYLWEAYIKDDAECELNCKPIGMKYFATLAKTVIDGTKCFYPSEYTRRRDSSNAICVEGSCLTVHNSGIISGQFMNSGAVKCGANICKPVTGVFTRNPLPPGYIDITMIPAGASNISVTEMKNSGNLLVLKTVEGRFVINANFKTSPSGLYEAAGAVFDYRRLDGLRNFSGGVQEGVTEWITCMGPTTEAIYLMILAERPNPGVKYDYLLPIKANVMTNSEENFGNESGETSLLNGLKAADQSISEHSSNHRRRRFMWKVIGLSPCTKTCGGGIQTPIIKCIRENPTRVFNPKRCAHLRQPETSETQTKCNVQPCPPYWKLSEWTSCRCDEHKVQEWRSREVKCVQELVSGIVIHVNHAACIEDEPSEREKCLCLNNRKPSEQTISSIRNKNRKKIEEERKYGTWLVSNWSDECSMACGVGLQYRSIFCDRSTSPNFERCDLRLNPETTRECSSNEKCSFGEWFTGPWSKCSGDCFNLTKSRSIVCIKNDGFASDDECNLEEKPSVSEKCPMTEVTYCRPKWHYSEWTKCSKSCGSGTQRRNVKCIEPNTDQMKESKNCRFSEREVAHRKCNEEKCQATISTTDPSFDPRVDLIQNDSSCVDDFPNCHLVIKAKLCSYTYYTNHCCQSCKIQLNELN